MLTTAPYLHIRRPSPATISYTVSTAPVPSLPHTLVLLTTHLFRLLTSLAIVILLHAALALHTTYTPPIRYQPAPATFTNDNIWHTISLLHSSSLGLFATRLSSLTPLPVLLPVLSLLAYLTIQRPYTCESLLVLRGLGIQTSSSSATYLSSATTRFIPTEKIQDILVNEAFRGFEVRYYLVVVVKGEGEVVVVFPGLLPKRRIVERVWRGARECLWEPNQLQGEKDGN